MASTAAPQASYLLLLKTQNTTNSNKDPQQLLTIRKKGGFRVFAAGQGPRKRQRAPPGVDTRIHWDNPDEGWIGGSSTSTSQQRLNAEEEKKNLLGDKFADLLKDAAGSHYQ